MKKMKFLLLINVLTFSRVAYADLNYSPSGPSEETIKATQDLIGDFLLSMRGVNGYGTTACEEKSGKHFMSYSDEEIEKLLFEYCIEITTESKAAEAALKVLFPIKAKYNGIYIVIDYTGPILPITK